MVTSLSRVLDPTYNSLWNALQKSDHAAVNLMISLEVYTQVLAQNMAQLFTQPFDAVHDNLGTIETEYIHLFCPERSVLVNKYNKYYF